MTELLDDVMKALKGFDATMEPTSKGYAEAVIMLAALSVGADEAKLAAALEYDPEFVALVGNRLRTAGIWSEGGTEEGFFKRWTGEDGGVAFLLDTNVADGSMLIARMDGEEPMYSMSESGKRHVENLLAR